MSAFFIYFNNFSYLATEAEPFAVVPFVVESAVEVPVEFPGLAEFAYQERQLHRVLPAHPDKF